MDRTMQSIVVLLVLLCFHLVEGKLQDQLPKDVHEYDVTTLRVHHQSRRIKGGSQRDATHLSFTALGSSHLLTLKKLKSTSPYGKYGIPLSVIEENSTITKLFSYTENGIDFYQGTNFKGVFAVHTNNGSQHAHGVVHDTTEDLVVEPVSEGGTLTANHVVYRRTRTKGDVSGDTVSKRRVSGGGFRYDTFNPGSLTGGSVQSYPGSSGIGSFHPGSLDGTGRTLFSMLSDSGVHVVQAPSIVRTSVEVLVWTDLALFESFQKLVGNSNVELEILKYIAVVVHSGNLLFHHGIRDPSLHVSVTLTGVIICKTIKCSRFTHDHASNGGVDNHVALDGFAVALRESYRLHSLTFRYDYAVAFTRYDLTDTHGNPIGVSFTDDICSVQDGKSSSILEDQGGFSCIGTFVHELAHTLGSDHDGWFRSRMCSGADGYIMSAISPLTKNGFYFSSCSIKSMKENLLKSNASCVRDNAHSNQIYEALGRSQLPGQIYNRTEQCKQTYGTNFCLSIGTTLSDICYKMYCWDPVLPNVCSTKSSAAPGTSCGSHRWCMNGECVYSKEAP